LPGAAGLGGTIIGPAINGATRWPFFTSRGFVVIEPVLHDLAASPAHGFVGLRQQDALAALIEGLHPSRTVNEVNRCGGGVLLGLGREAARGDENPRAALVAVIASRRRNDGDLTGAGSAGAGRTR